MGLTGTEMHAKLPSMHFCALFMKLRLPFFLIALIFQSFEPSCHYLQQESLRKNVGGPEDSLTRKSPVL